MGGEAEREKEGGHHSERELAEACEATAAATEEEGEEEPEMRSAVTASRAWR